MNKKYLSSSLMKSLAVFSLIGFLVSCGGGSGGDAKVNDGEASDSSTTLKYATPNLQIGGTSDYLIAIATDTESPESFSIIGEIDENGAPTSISGIVFIAEDGSYSEIRIGEDGLPLTYSEGNGYTLEFSNYTPNSVDISVYDQYDFLVEGPTTIEDPNDFISRIISSPLILDAQSSKFANNKPANKSSGSLDSTLESFMFNTGLSASATSCLIEFADAVLDKTNTKTAALACSSPLAAKIGSLTGVEFFTLYALVVDSTFCAKAGSTLPNSLERYSANLSCASATAAAGEYHFKRNFTIQVPKNLEARPGNHKVSLRWSPVPEANSYIIFYKKAGDSNAEYQLINNIMDVTYVHPNRVNGVKYEYKIKGVRNDGEETEPSKVETVIPYQTIPPKPQNVSVSNISHNKATITWDRIPNVKKVIVYYSKEPFKGETAWGAPKGWWLKKQIDFDLSVFVKPPSATRIRLLNSSTQYYFVIYSNVDGIWSPISDVATVTTLSAPVLPPILPDPPSSPLKLYYMPDPAKVRLWWPGSLEATSYNLYWGTTSGQSPESHRYMLNIKRDRGDNHVFDDIPYDKEYFFTVTAVNESGEGPVSNEVSRIIASPSVIDPPTLLTPISSDGEVALAWDSVSGAERYDVYWGTTSGQSPASYGNLLSNANSPVIIPDLINDINYYFTVTATTGTTESLPSTERIAVPPPPLPVSDDHDNNISTATPIALNSTALGFLETGTDIDCFRIDIPQDGDLSLYTTGTTDTTGGLTIDGVNFIAVNDDAVPDVNLNFKITQAVNAGVYYVCVSLFSEIDTGPYTLNSEFTPVSSIGIDAENTVKGQSWALACETQGAASIKRKWVFSENPLTYVQAVDIFSDSNCQTFVSTTELGAGTYGFGNAVTTTPSGDQGVEFDITPSSSTTVYGSMFLNGNFFYLSDYFSSGDRVLNIDYSQAWIKQ